MADASEYSNGNLSSAFAAANRGALTTIFTPPGTCLTETTLVSFLTTSDSSTEFFTTTKLFINHFSWGDPDCYPSTIASLNGYTRWNNGYYYSPGICPSGWTSACQQTANALGFSTTMDSDTSIAMCCPSSNWACVGGATSFTGHGCSTNLYAGQTLTSVWPAAMPTPDTSMLLPSQRLLTTLEITSNTSALCDAIPVLWQNTDYQILSLLGEPVTADISSTSSSTRGLLSNAIPTETGAASSSLQSSSTHLDLSRSAKIGIGVSLPILFIALVLGIFFYFRHRNVPQEIEETGEEFHMDEIDWSYLDTSRKTEMPSEGLPAEMDANRETRELETARVVHEMPDTSIPEMSMRDTSRHFTLKNYITDIISQSGAVAGPDISNNLIPQDIDTGFMTPTIHAPPTESSHSTRVNSSFTPNNDKTDGISTLSGASLNGCKAILNNLPSSNDNTHTSVICPVNDARRFSPSPTALRDAVHQPTSSPNPGDANIVSPISDSPQRWFSIMSITEPNQITNISNNDNEDIVSPISAGTQRGDSTISNSDPKSSLHSSCPSPPPVPRHSSPHLPPRSSTPPPPPASKRLSPPLPHSLN